MTHSLKSKLLNLLLLITSLFGFLEWGAGNHRFLFQAEAEIIEKMIADPSNGLHPLVILPLIGQILLLITLFQQNPGKIITHIGMFSLGILLLLMFFIGCIDFNLKILASSIPFLLMAVLTILHHRKKAANPS